MKTLLLESPTTPINMTRVHAGLRQNTGTCEVYPISEAYVRNLSRFFERFIRLGQYDRIVIEFDQETIYQQSPFLRQLPNLTVLALDNSWTLAERRRLKLNLAVMPWMRWIGDDPEMYRQLVRMGMDAYWVNPIYDPDHYHLRRRTSPEIVCHVYDGSGKLRDFLSEVLPPEKQVALQFHPFDAPVMENISPGDYFLYWPKADEKLPRKMIEAMACGAVVLTWDPGVVERVRYGWRDYENCVFVANAKSAAETINILCSYPEMGERISRSAIEHAERFHPFQVGVDIGVALSNPVRKSIDYPKKRRIFGIEF